MLVATGATIMMLRTARDAATQLMIMTTTLTRKQMLVATPITTMMVTIAKEAATQLLIMTATTLIT